MKLIFVSQYLKTPTIYSEYNCDLSSCFLETIETGPKYKYDQPQISQAKILILIKLKSFHYLIFVSES